MERTKRVFWISAIVLMFSLTVAIFSCFYVMERAQATGEIGQEQELEGLVNGSAAEISFEPTAQPGEMLFEPEYIETVVKEVSYHGTWIYDENDEETIPEDKHITVLQALEAVQQHVKAYYGFEYSKNTNVDINFVKYEKAALYFVTINNNAIPDRIPAPGEREYLCIVNGNTGKVSGSRRNDFDEQNANENIFTYDEDGNKVGWDYPSYFTNSKELKQLKKECIQIAEKFLIASNDYTKEELTYVKTEAYEDQYPWTVCVTFEKGNEVIHMYIGAENKEVYEYDVN